MSRLCLLNRAWAALEHLGLTASVTGVKRLAHFYQQHHLLLFGSGPTDSAAPATFISRQSNACLGVYVLLDFRHGVKVHSHVGRGCNVLIQRAEDDLNELERRAEELRLKAAAIAAEIAQVEQEAKDLRTAIAVWNRYEAPATPQVVSQNTEAGSIKEGSPVERQRETQVSPDNPGSNPFHGKGMAEAAVVALTLRGYPMTYLEITDDLLSGGGAASCKNPRNICAGRLADCGAQRRPNSFRRSQMGASGLVKGANR